MKSDPQTEHLWLEQLVGSWSFEGECDSGPGQPAHKSQGKEDVKAIGGLWVIAEGVVELPGVDEGLTRMTLGFDPAKGRFVGSWVGSMMTHMWVYDGHLDEGGRVLTLETTGPSFSGDGGTSNYQDIITIVDDYNRTLTSRVLTADGTWNQFLETRYRRLSEPGEK